MFRMNFVLILRNSKALNVVVCLENTATQYRPQAGKYYVTRVVLDYMSLIPQVSGSMVKNMELCISLLSPWCYAKYW